MASGKPARKYAPLTAFLRAQPPEVERVTLAVAELEALIGGRLPRSAYAQRRSWWSNGRSVDHARAWLSVGWRVAALPWRPDGPPFWGVTFARAGGCDRRASRRALVRSAPGRPRAAPARSSRG